MEELTQTYSTFLLTRNGRGSESQQNHHRIPLLSAIVLLLVSGATRAQTATPADEDVFKAAVRTTEALSPQEELASFQVPDGFEVSLFASELQIQKPLNMAFDADGRLWVTGSNEYPYPAKEGAGHDSIRILEDTTGDGVADKVSVFADDLNIPMGLYPYQDGVVVFSIPNILFLRDTDGDGKADSREVLYGPFDTTRDTHGMNNAFRRGFDGWLYCCHGFNNQSKVAGTDGHSVSMNSGNTYRVRLDGSRIEHLTHGQVNPFGMAIDANGDVFNSDCHTKPVTLLLRGGYYESFGKPHDGLGFVPAVMDHLHGSTAIDGLCQYQDTVFPDEFQNDIFVGNVMTSRIHRNSIARTGSSIRMQEEPDFLTSTDPWFRPVDIQIGHDGAMYIADFYNRIIGHYEVPLDHPGRDRTSGRIWRIAYVGKGSETANVSNSNSNSNSNSKMTAASLTELLAILQDDRKFIRQHAADQIVDRLGSDAVPAVVEALESSMNEDEQTDAPQLLWVLQRLGALTNSQLHDAFSRGTTRTRIHVMRNCSEFANRDELVSLLRDGLRDPEAMVRRAAADAAAQTPNVDVAKEVVNAMVVCSPNDVHLHHALKIALNHQLSDSKVAEWFGSSIPPAAACQALSTVVNAVEGEAAGKISVALLQSGHLQTEQLDQIVNHAARNMTSESAAELFNIAKRLPQTATRLKTAIWLAMAESLRARNLQIPEDFQKWSGELAVAQLSTTDVSDLSWGSYSLDGRPVAEWGDETRSVQGSSQKLQFLSSLVSGEKGVGLIRSRPFVLPFSIEIPVCGHLGLPADAPSPENRVVLRDYDTGQEIESVLAPRNDVATVHKWSCGKFAGRQGYLEVIDGLSLPSYAWIAVGRPTPMIVKNEVLSSRQSEALQSAIRILRDQIESGAYLPADQLQHLAKIVKAVQVDGALRSLAAETLLLHQQKPELKGLADLLQIGSTPRLVDEAIVRFCVTTVVDQATDSISTTSAQNESDENRELLLVKYAFSLLDAELRNRLTQQLSTSREGAALLLASMETGFPSASVLRDERLVVQMSAYGSEFASQIDNLVKSLPAEDTDTTQLTEDIVKRIKLGDGNAEKGLAIFEKNCLNCHRRSGVGGVAGPQLDGVATRGTARLLEDILHPNRNVDVAFRTSTLLLTNGKVITGIVRPGNASHQLTAITSDGKLIEVFKTDVEERKDSTLSLMPGNVASLLSEDQLLNLTAFLLQ